MLKKLSFSLTLLASSLMMNAQTFSSASIDLVNDSGTTILSHSGSGTLLGYSCYVTTAVTGSVLWGVQYQVDGGASTQPPAIYGVGTTGVNTNNGAYCNGNMLSVGQHCVIPLHVSYTTSILLSSVPFSSASTGALKCTAVRK